MDRLRVIVVGNGMVGQRFVEEVVNGDTSERFSVVVFGEESRPAYDRLNLARCLSGSDTASLSIVEPGFFERHGVDLHLNDRVETIDRSARVVLSQGGARVQYDVLVLATGSRPLLPPVAVPMRPGFHVFRTIDDLDAIRAQAKTSGVGTVVGGGLLGLEAAQALRELGLQAHVVERAPRLMATQLDEVAGALLARKLQSLGMAVHVGKTIGRIDPGPARQHRMIFDDGSTLDTDLVVFCVGVKPRDELARQAGIDTAVGGGIVIDDHCRTSDPNIYAIGDCVVWNGERFGLVGPGYQMARVTASRLSGGEASFSGGDPSTALKLTGVDVATIGDGRCETRGALSYNFLDDAAGVYKRLVVSSDGRQLIGALLVGETQDYGALQQLHVNGSALPQNPAGLLGPDGASGDAFNADQLPDTAMICSCANLTKGDIDSAIGAGHTSMAALRQVTGASTGCGGCATLVRRVLGAGLKRSGQEINNNLCEHFDHSRRDLYDIVRVGRITTFQDLLRIHGRGAGCNICKTAIASILASCWNDYILEDHHTTIQDTNDLFLANMQRNGTYSVIPRIPGGEITPQGLMTIGRIAAEYGLYAKITGGQRIGLYGARVDQLPPIWKELTDAGFESGHAYGKAMRTVKSCVGSTWCSYGMGNSLRLSIDLENRYRGLRAPHKLKLAVSGCGRECAEARSKDVGIIATEKGWSLEVCGNGGMRPRHTTPLATDLDETTLVRILDRFFMFYVRTADRAQRTADWLESLVGGIDYLREVVLENRLGINDELERDMSRIVETYECEWKRTLRDKRSLRRFRHFINSDQVDDTVVFVTERGQIRPASSTDHHPSVTAKHQGASP